MDESGFLVEDGSGLIGSNSYVSVESADEYYKIRAYTEWADLPLEIKQAVLVRATLYVDSQYDWKGTVEYDDQGLNFPRIGIINPRNEVVIGVPNSVKRATLEIGRKVLTFNEDGTYTFRDLLPDVEVGNKVKKLRQKFGVAEEETIYMTATEMGNSRPFPSIDALIPKYLLNITDKDGAILTTIICTPFTLNVEDYE